MFVSFFPLSIQKLASAATYSPREEKEGSSSGLSSNYNSYSVQNIPKEDTFSYAALTQFYSPSTNNFPTENC